MARILIVDDNPDVRELLVTMFRLRGHDPLALADGHALLAELHRRPADLCLVDWMMPGMDGPEVLSWMMPGMDGPEVLSRIRDDPDRRTAATPVVMLTSADVAEHRYVARRGGAQTYLNKGTPLHRMFEALSPYLAASEQPNPSSSKSNAPDGRPGP